LVPIDTLVLVVARFQALSGKQIDANTAEFTLKRAGNPVGTIRRTVSSHSSSHPTALLFTARDEFL
jgi:hypothetical protein